MNELRHFECGGMIDVGGHCSRCGYTPDLQSLYLSTEPEQREREARPKESACPHWDDGQHSFQTLRTGDNSLYFDDDTKRCACGATVGRTKT